MTDAVAPPLLRALRVRWLALCAGGLLALAIAGCGDPPAEAPGTTPVSPAVATAGTGGTLATPSTSPAGGQPSGSAGGASTPDAEVDVDRAYAHIEVLAAEIGVRSASTEGERAAARYIRDVFAEAGYDPAIEPFAFDARFDESSVTLGDEVVRGYAFGGSALDSVTAVLADGGRGLPEEVVGGPVDGQIVVVARGTIMFAEKAANAEAAGAVGLIIVNNQPGPYRGTLGEMEATIPVIAVPAEATDLLVQALGSQVTVDASAGSRTLESENVVARNGECRAYVGGHYDSVPAGPGANDNASGTALVMELARVHRSEGLCYVAFGAEEVGLRGSQAFVSRHLVGAARFMLNFDMAGRVDGPIIVGDDALTEHIMDILERGPTHPLQAGSFPPFASSDHVSFTSVGVPAVTITSGDDPAIHTADDELSRIDRDSLEVMLRAADTMVEALVAARLD